MHTFTNWSFYHSLTWYSAFVQRSMQVFHAPPAPLVIPLNRKGTRENKDSSTDSFSSVLGFMWIAFINLFIYLYPCLLNVSQQWATYISFQTFLQLSKIVCHSKLQLQLFLLSVTEWPTVSPAADLLYACEFKLSIMRKLLSQSDSDAVAPAFVCSFYPDTV